MTKPKIIILIPWNLPIEGISVGALRAQAALANPDWFPNRLAIWKRYAMPTLIGQSHPDFTAYVLCDPTTTEQNETVLATLTDRRFRLIAGSGVYQVIDELSKEDGPEDLFVCCRMDNDDMWHRNLLTEFVAALPRAARQRRSYVQAAKGYALDVSTQTIYHWNNPSPSFLGFICRRNALRDSICPIWRDHGAIASLAVSINSRPLFCVTINGLNVWNTIDCPWVGPVVTGTELDQVKADYGL